MTIGQYWLTSWGYKTELPVDNEKLVKLGRDASDAVKTVTPSRQYTVGSAGAIFYIAGGASDDYAKVRHNIFMRMFLNVYFSACC